MPLKTGDCETPKLSELRIVLMGYKGAGKSSSGNIILNREEFDLKRTDQCVKRQREVADRHITVIEAPGWWRHEPVDQSSELLKQEILLSVSQCPHIVLLVIRADVIFKEDERKVFQGYVDLLSERVWSHTIVLFTFGDFLGDTSIEQHIEREGKGLQWLVEKCGNRYHVLNNKNRSDDTQIKDLLEKIEETVTQNNGCCFRMDGNILQEQRRRVEGERARMSGDEMSDTLLLKTSGFDSVRSRPGADYSPVFASSLSKDRPSSFGGELSYKTVLRQKFRSGDEKFDQVSLGSSGYSSFRSRSGADNPFFASSQSKDRPISFGDGSVNFTLGDLGMVKTMSLPMISKLSSKHKNKQKSKKQTS